MESLATPQTVSKLESASVWIEKYEKYVLPICQCNTMLTPKLCMLNLIRVHVYNYKTASLQVSQLRCSASSPPRGFGGETEFPGESKILRGVNARHGHGTIYLGAEHQICCSNRGLEPKSGLRASKSRHIANIACRSCIWQTPAIIWKQTI